MAPSPRPPAAVGPSECPRTASLPPSHRHVPVQPQRHLQERLPLVARDAPSAQARPGEPGGPGPQGRRRLAYGHAALYVVVHDQDLFHAPPLAAIAAFTASAAIAFAT